jgi:hypothetical protein
MGSKHKKVNRRRLLIEPLEDRRLLATITVTSLSDGTLAQLAGDGQVSLREAIEAANDNISVDGSVAGSAGLDSIVFQAGLSGDVSLQDGQFEVSEPLDITGNGRTNTVIDAHNASRVFRAFPDGAFVLRDLTIERGRTTQNANLGYGGAILFTSNSGSLAILDSTVRDSSTEGSGAKGGAVYVDGDVTIFLSDVTDNSTTDDNALGGAVYATGNVHIGFSTISGNETLGDLAHGGAIAAGGDITIEHSDLRDNAALSDSKGGAIYGKTGRNLSLNASTLTDNSASASGGGAYAFRLNSLDSTIFGNTANGEGGGILSAYATITSSLITGNSAASEGGGLFTTTLAAVDSTWSNNVAHQGAGISMRIGRIAYSTLHGNTALFSGGGIDVRSSEALILQNSTITGNRVQGDPNARGGGGLYTHSGRLYVNHSTVSGNTVVGPSAAGGGINGLNQPNVHLLNSIVAGNGSSTGVAPDFRVGNVFFNEFTSYYSLIGDNSDSPIDEANPNRDANGNLVGGPSTGIIDPVLGVLKDRGGPTQTLAVSLVSPALEFGVEQLGGLLPFNDQRGPGYPRSQDGDDDGVSHVDAGAFELRLIVAAAVSFQFKVLVGGFVYGPDDLAHYDPGTDTWSMYFDGSDVGLAGAAIDAYHEETDGSLLLSFDETVFLASLGDVLPADIVRFVPSSLGAQTAGSFELLHSGFALGLDASVDNIDAIARTSDGRLVISTDNDVFLNFGIAHAHDLLAIDGNELLPYFEGELVGLETLSENITGVWFEPDTDVIFMTTQGSFDVPGVSGNEGDVIAFAPTSLEGATAGKFHPFTRLAGVDLDVALAGMNIQYSDVVTTTITGDFDYDGDRDGDDIDGLISNIAIGPAHPTTFDLTNDGQVNLDDRDQWLALAGALNLPSGNPYLLGDANLDGSVDGQDFIAWNAHKFTAVSTWSMADFNADGVADGQDFIIWNDNRFQSSDSSSHWMDDAGSEEKRLRRQRRFPTPTEMIFGRSNLAWGR